MFQPRWGGEEKAGAKLWDLAAEAVRGAVLPGMRHAYDRNVCDLRAAKWLPPVPAIWRHRFVEGDLTGLLRGMSFFYPSPWASPQLAGIVTKGSPSLPPVSVRENRIMRNAKVLFDWKSRSSIQNQ